MTKEEAIKLVKEVAGMSLDWDDAHYEALQAAIKARADERFENRIGWIPVSETLPEDRRPVLVTAYWHETYQTMMASYFGGGVWWCVPFNNTGKHEQKLKPKAWMPLPDPYKPKESEDK